VPSQAAAESLCKGQQTTSFADAAAASAAAALPPHAPPPAAAAAAVAAAAVVYRTAFPTHSNSVVTPLLRQSFFASEHFHQFRVREVLVHDDVAPHSLSLHRSPAPSLSSLRLSLVFVLSASAESFLIASVIAGGSSGAEGTVARALRGGWRR
jgi:ADP-ribosylglycohydrolase